MLLVLLALASAAQFKPAQFDEDEVAVRQALGNLMEEEQEPSSILSVQVSKLHSRWLYSHHI